MLAPNIKSLTIYMRPVTVRFNLVKIPKDSPENFPRFSFNNWKKGTFRVVIGDGHETSGNNFEAGHQETVITEIKFIEPKREKQEQEQEQE